MFTFDDICDRTYLMNNNLPLEDIIIQAEKNPNNELVLPFEYIYTGAD